MNEVVTGKDGHAGFTLATGRPRTEERQTARSDGRDACLSGLMTRLRRILSCAGGACLLLCMSAVVRAQGGEGVFSGKIEGYAGSDTLFCYFGETADYDTVAIRSDGSFSLSVPMKEEKSVLVFWQGRNARKHDAMCVTMSPGKTLEADLRIRQVKPDSVVLEAEFSGDCAAKSEYTNLYYYYMSKSSDFTDETLAALPDFKACEEYVGQRFGRLSGLLERVDDKAFVEREKSEMARAVPQFCLRYAEVKEKAGTKMEDDAGFDAFVKGIDVNDTANVEAICGYLAWDYAAHPGRYSPLTGEAAQLKHLKVVVTNPQARNMVANRYMQGQLFLIQFGADPATDEMKDFYEQYADVSTDTTYSAFISQQMEIIRRNAPGGEAVDFPLMTADGQEVGFKSLVGNGKVVYVDFWATWCAPCRAEIPYMEKLAEHYKDNEGVCLMSVSIDTDEKAWKGKIEADRPAWAQYNIPRPDQSEGVKHYNITTIPRFMLFDKEGRLYKSSAPRPSDPGIRETIDSLLR